MPTALRSRLAPVCKDLARVDRQNKQRHYARYTEPCWPLLAMEEKTLPSFPGVYRA
jgi:hypothetical protein